MRNIIFCSLACILILGCSRLQIIPDSERKYQKVYNINMSADEIFNRSLIWMNNHFVTSRDTIDIKDKKTGTLAGRGSGVYSEYLGFLVDRRFSYSMRIEIKKNKFRITYENLYVYYEEREISHVPAMYKHEIDSIRVRLDKQSEDLYKFIQDARKGSAPSKDDNW